MVFSSIPPYLDPANWQQTNTQPGDSSTTAISQFSLPPQLAPAHKHNGVGSCSIRPGSMADQAKMANIPMPEAALKCPRCDSTNTKFCYYNNYNLNQPRYLCKACKRYWTKGGTRRNVPVGGGSRRNKRSKSSASSSSSKSSPSDGSGNPSGGGTLGLLSPQIHPYRFMPPSSSRLGEFIHGDIGLQYGGISSPLMETNNFNHGSIASGVEPWRLQTSNSLNGIRHSIISPWVRTTQSSGLETLPLQGSDEESRDFPHHHHHHHHLSRMKLSMPVKLKESDHEELNLSRQILMLQGDEHNNHQYNTNWGSGNAGTSSWTDLSGFSSSSTTTNNPL